MPATTTTAPLSGIEVGTLGEVTPDYGGTLEEGDGGFPIDMWKGTDRALVERLLPQLSNGASSPAMRDLERRLLLTNAEAPVGKSGGVNLFSARADRLVAMGDLADAAALLAMQPPGSVDPATARQRIDVLLLSGDVDGACKAVDDTRKVASGDAAWQKAQIFCQLRAGQNDQAALGLDLLREQDENDPTFFSLADAMAGNSPSDARKACRHRRALDLAMLHAANLPIPRDAAQARDPGVLAAIARDTSIDPGDSPGGGRTGSRHGHACPSTSCNWTMRASPIRRATSAMPSRCRRSDPGPGSRAMLFQAAGVAIDTTQRARILQAALDRARHQGGYLLAVQANLQFLLPLVPAEQSDIGRRRSRPRALFGRAITSRRMPGWRWRNRARSTDPQAAAAVSSLAVYARIAGVGQPLAWDAASVAKWREAQSANNPAGDSSARLFAIFEGLGEPIGGSWSMIGQGGDSRRRARSGLVVQPRRCRGQPPDRRNRAALALRARARWAGRGQPDICSVARYPACARSGSIPRRAPSPSRRRLPPGCDGPRRQRRQRRAAGTVSRDADGRAQRGQEHPRGL